MGLYAYPTYYESERRIHHKTHPPKMADPRNWGCFVDSCVERITHVYGLQERHDPPAKHVKVIYRLACTEARFKRSHVT